MSLEDPIRFHLTNISNSLVCVSRPGEQPMSIKPTSRMGSEVRRQLTHLRMLELMNPLDRALPNPGRTPLRQPTRSGHCVLLRPLLCRQRPCYLVRGFAADSRQNVYRCSSDFCMPFELLAWRSAGGQYDHAKHKRHLVAELSWFLKRLFGGGPTYRCALLKRQAARRASPILQATKRADLPSTAHFCTQEFP
jgi:hypothetical protein